MAHQVTVCPNCRLGHVQFSGVVTGQGLLRVLYDTRKAGRWDLTCNEVWDLRGARDVFIKPAEAERLAGHLPDRDDDSAVDDDALGRTALIVRTTSHKAYGIVLCRSLRPYNRVHRSFFSVRQAARWIKKSAQEQHALAESCGTEQARPRTFDAECDGLCMLND